MTRPVVVLKFGGAALATPPRIRRAARRVGAWVRRGHAPVAVVSACGSTTDRILRWIAAVTRDAEPPGREADRALATGEDLAASLLAAALEAAGFAAVALSGGEAGLEGTGPHGAGSLTGVDPRPLQELLDRGRIPVVPGFQAVTPDGRTVTLGRGTSDLSAVRVAAALGAVSCHLVKDVPGVHDRDPRLHTDARRLARLAAPDLARMARAGAAVVHPGAADAAHARGVRLRVYGFADPFFGRHGTTVEATADGAYCTRSDARPDEPDVCRRAAPRRPGRPPAPRSRRPR